MKKLVILLFLISFHFGFCQTKQIYILKVKMLNVHSEPGTDNPVIHQLKEGDEVHIISVNDDWYKIDLGNKTGHILAPTLNQNEFWTKKMTTPPPPPSSSNCDNITPKYDYKLKNYLEIVVGPNTDAVVKLMKIGSSQNMCYRIAHLKSNSSYKIRNIPEGQYYLKIAYGREWEQEILNGKCYGKFTKGAIYEKGSETYDFTIIKTSSGYQVPSYDLSLDKVSEGEDAGDSTNKISEAEFNN